MSRVTLTPYAIYAANVITYTADESSLTLSGTLFSLKTGGITPTHLSGLSGNGTAGQVLGSNGSGAFAWQDSLSGSASQAGQVTFWDSTSTISGENNLFGGG